MLGLSGRVHQSGLEALKLLNSRAMHELLGFPLEIGAKELRGSPATWFFSPVPISVNPSLQSFPTSSLYGPRREWFSLTFSEGRGRYRVVVALVHEYKWVRQQT